MFAAPVDVLNTHLYFKMMLKYYYLCLWEFPQLRLFLDDILSDATHLPRNPINVITVIF